MARLLLVLIAVTAALLALAAAPAGGGGATPGGRILYVTNGDRINSVDVASGAKVTRRVSVASCGPDVYLTGGHVVFAELRKGRTIVYSVPAELDERPRRLGTAHSFVPSATDGRIWMAGTVCKRRRLSRAREVTVDGEVTVRSRRTLPTAWLSGAAAEGLLVQERRAMTVWDPRSGRTLRALDDLKFVGGSRGNTVVGCAEGTRCRALAISDAATGETLFAEAEEPYRFSGLAEFSPDGSQFATHVGVKGRWSVAVVDTAKGSVTHVPGSRTKRVWPEVAWSQTSGWLFIRVDRGRVKAYLPGGRAVTLPLRVPRWAVNFMAG